MDSAVTAVAPKRYPKKAISCQSSIWSTHFPKPYPAGLLFGQKQTATRISQTTRSLRPIERAGAV